jgi:hypothetical protein
VSLGTFVEREPMAQRDLPLVVEALQALGLLFGSRQGGQQHARQNGERRDDHEQFNERESSIPCVLRG